MTPVRRHVPPLIDLSGWDRLPERHRPLAGQMNLFDVDTLKLSLQAEVAEASSAGDQPELFATGRDLPGAAERSQQILWDIG
jgi:hypothetical protein